MRLFRWQLGATQIAYFSADVSLWFVWLRLWPVGLAGWRRRSVCCSHPARCAPAAGAAGQMFGRLCGHSVRSAVRPLCRCLRSAVGRSVVGTVSLRQLSVRHRVPLARQCTELPERTCCAARVICYNKSLTCSPGCGEPCAVSGGFSHCGVTEHGAVVMRLCLVYPPPETPTRLITEPRTVALSLTCRAAESESESKLELVGADSFARSWKRSLSHQKLTDSDAGVGVNAAWLNIMHCACLIDDTALDIL